MAQFAGRYVALEMVALGLLELLLTFALAFVLLAPEAGGVFGNLRAANLALALSLTVGLTAAVVGFYRSQTFGRPRNLVLSTLLGALMAAPAVLAVSKVTGLSAEWPLAATMLRSLKILTIWAVALLAMRFLFLAALRLNLFVRRVAVLDAGDLSPMLAAIRNGRHGLIEMVSAPPDRRSPEALRLARVSGAIMSVEAQAALTPAARAEFADAGIRIQTEPEFWETYLKRINVANLSPEWVASLPPVQAASLSSTITRAADILTASVFVLITAPLMLLTSVLIRLDSPGPILYRQQRVGLGGVPFTLLKFRSMRLDAEARGPAWAQQRDPRVTRIGSLMRRTRIDELPQLLNILRGEMGFIGPRPERPHFVEQLAQIIPFYEERTRVRPGLTGWAQVNFPYGASVEDARSKLSYDLYYVKHRSPLLDVIIMFSTIRVILLQEGAR